MKLTNVLKSSIKKTYASLTDEWRRVYIPEPQRESGRIESLRETSPEMEETRQAGVLYGTNSRIKARLLYNGEANVNDLLMKTRKLSELYYSQGKDELGLAVLQLGSVIALSILYLKN